MNIPEQIGQYRVIEELGRGGMGVVYRGEVIETGLPVAIKFLNQCFPSEDSVLRFKREAKIASILNSKNNLINFLYFVKFYELLEYYGTPCYVMELVDGIALSDMIDEDVVPTPAQLTERLFFFRQVLKAVECAHGMEIVHRDLKPGNIMITNAGQVKVLDFGLACLNEQHSLTEFGGLGTLGYRSPEQTFGYMVDKRTDIYSLGVILFELITGNLPFTATNSQEMFRKVSEVPPPSPRSINPTISPELEAITLRMLAKRPEERFQNIREILAVYDRAVACCVQPVPQHSFSNLQLPHLPGLQSSQGELGTICTSSESIVQKPIMDAIFIVCPKCGWCFVANSQQTVDVSQMVYSHQCPRCGWLF